MTYNTLIFAVFLLAALLFYFIVPKRGRWIVLLMASYAFYLFNNSFLVVFILITTLSVYLCGRLLGGLADRFKKAKKELDREGKKALKEKTNRKKKWVVFAVILINFGLLFFLKYFNFLGGSAASLIGLIDSSFVFRPLDLMLPLGISFYTLQAVSYVVDVYRGKVQADKNLGRVALFLVFFPQIMEGPIGRYDQLAYQLYEGHSFDYTRFKYGGQLILWGLFKKMVVADRASIFVDTVFRQAGVTGGIPVVMAVLLYTLQIYAEFSGTMDIVTGVAQLFGVNLAENFKRPFFSRSVQEFWRRWHITLGAWLRDYIFYPISFSKFFMNLSKKAKKNFNEHFGKLVPVAFAMFFVWFGNGIWHGASWKYVMYGLYYYLIMMIGLLFEPLTRKLIAKIHINTGSRGYRFWQMARTFLFVCFGMLIFRAKDLPQAFSMFGSIFTGFDPGVLTSGALVRDFGLYTSDILLLLLSVILILAVGIMQEKGLVIRDVIAKRKLVVRWAVYYIGIFSVILFGAYGAGYRVIDLIYAQF